MINSLFRTRRTRAGFAAAVLASLFAGEGKPAQAQSNSCNPAAQTTTQPASNSALIPTSTAGRITPTGWASPTLPGTAITLPGHTGVTAGQQIREGKATVTSQAPEWIFTPRLELSEIVTDNVRQTEKQRTSDLISVVSPGINITGDTPHLKQTLDYSPQIQRYIEAPDQNQIIQNLDFNAHAIVFPDQSMSIHAPRSANSRSRALGAQRARHSFRRANGSRRWSIPYRPAQGRATEAG